jgi:8-oxo-(d)GTP phosphatase
MPSRRSGPEIRAAGGAVWRVRKSKLEVALVHRPRYDDWSLPKGKLHEGEPELAGAVREVNEEMGSRVAVSRLIGHISYNVATARKTVGYWVMRHLDGEFAPNDEVDDVAWVRPKSARDKLTYHVDRRVMSDFAAVPVPDSVILLVRHAKAGKRSEWSGDDDRRPLDPAGQDQAKRLVEFLTMFAPDRVLSAEPDRCIQTVTPLADALGLDVQVQPAFGDAAFHRSASTTENALLGLAKPGQVSVVCSQGSAIPGLIDRVGRASGRTTTRKAAAWALSIVDGNIVSSDYYEDAIR